MRAMGSILAIVFLALAAGCAGRLGAPSESAKAELASTGALRVALFTGNPVIASKNRVSGELSGTAFSLGKALAEDAGVRFAPMEYTTVAKLMDDAKSGVWDIAVVGIDPARRGVVDYTPAYVVVDITYLVAPGSSIRSVADADQPGVRITAARGAATALLLERTLKQARLTPAESEPAAFELIREGKADAYAQNRFMLLGLAERLPGARVLDDRLSAIQLAVALPKGRPAAVAYVSAWVEQAKTSGAVQRIIDTAGLRGVQVAPAAQ
jgi:polar amino acid transport system substrate-binding protein